jgi:hypothetical protein
MSIDKIKWISQAIEISFDREIQNKFIFHVTQIKNEGKFTTIFVSK